MPPIPIKSIIFAGILSFLELVAGIALIATGVGIPFGHALIEESITDCVFIGTSIYTRQFDWN